MERNTSILIRNAHSVMTGMPRDEARSSASDLRIQGGVITEMGRGLAANPGERVLDASDCVIYPGWVNTHHHLFQSLLKGVAGGINLTLSPWLQAVPFSAFVGRYEGRTDWWPLTDEARKPEVVERVLWEARSVLGRPYSFWKLAEVASHVMIHTRLPKAETDPGAMFCSEFVAHCFRVGGLDISPHSDVNTSPTDIAASGHFRYGGTVRHDPGLAPNVRQGRIDLLRAQRPRPAPAPKKAG